MKNFKRILLLAAIVVVLVLICTVVVVFARSKVDNDSNPVVTMEIENYGTIKIELYPDMAPNTVKNFVALVNSGYYNGKTISELEDSRIIGGFDLTAESEEDSKDSKNDSKKDSKKDAEVEDSEEEEEVKVGPLLSNVKTLKEGEEDDSYAIEGEFVEAGYTDNKLSHQRGVISMARDDYNDYQSELYMMQVMGYSSYLDTIVKLMDNSASGGFFIMTKNDISYDGQYAAFGKVIEGMEVVDKIAEVETKADANKDKKDKKSKETSDENADKTPNKEIKIKNVTVDTKGVKYGEPETTSKVDFSTLFGSLLQQTQGSN